jgi:hypothetical protein
LQRKMTLAVVLRVPLTRAFSVTRPLLQTPGTGTTTGTVAPQADTRPVGSSGRLESALSACSRFWFCWGRRRWPSAS